MTQQQQQHQTQQHQTQQQQQQKSIPLSLFRFNKNLADLDGMEQAMSARQIYVIKATPKVVPLDVNIAFLTRPDPHSHSSGWSQDLDRLRYSPDSLYIRKFEPTRDYCIVCHISTDTTTTTTTTPISNTTITSTTSSTGTSRQPTLIMYGNDAQMTEYYFQNLFTGGHLDVQPLELGVLTRGWVENPHEMLYFSGTIHSAFGVWGKMLVERQLGGTGGY